MTKKNIALIIITCLLLLGFSTGYAFGIKSNAYKNTDAEKTAHELIQEKVK